MPKVISTAQPPKPTPKPGKSVKEIGDSNILFNGVIGGQEYNIQLKGTRRIAKYDEMRLGDAHVGASLKVLKLPLLSANWRIQPGGNGKGKNKEIADFIDDALFNQPTRTWQETLTNILLHLDYGVMPFEIIYKWTEDDRVTLHKLAVRHPRTISKWELKDGANGVEQTTEKGVFYIPMEKMIIFVNEKEGDNWEGKSVLRNAFKHWLFKDKAELIEVMAMEKHGLGIPRGKTPTGATADDEAKMDNVLKNMRANEDGFVRHPQDWEIDFLDMKAGSIKNPNDFIKRQEWAIMLNVLATFMQMGSGAVGSFALFKGSNTFFLMALEYVAKHIAETINKYLIKKLVDFNFETDTYPELVYDKIGEVDVNTLTTALQRAIQTGVLTVDPELEVYLREVMDLPEKTAQAAIDPTLGDGILAELDSEVAGLEMSLMDEEPAEDGDEDPGETEDEEPTDEEIEEAAAAWFDRTKKAAFVKLYGSETWETMKTLQAAKGVPLSDEHKKKISEALKKLKAKGGKKLNAPKKGKKAKAKNPALEAKKADVKKLREEARKFSAQVRRERLEMRAAGKKMSPEEAAKKELDIFNKKEEISNKISKLQDEIEAIKDKAKAAAPAKKASEHNHEVGATPDSLLTMFEQVTTELDKVRNG